MATYRLGKPYTPRQPRGEPPASGFRMWTWGGQSSDVWATKTPDEVLADVRAAIEWAMLPERDISAELWEQLTPSQRLAAWRYYHGS